MSEPPSSDSVPFAVVLVMAGRGERFGGPVPKVFATVAGKPLWRHSAETFAVLPGRRRTVLVVAAEFVADVLRDAAGLADVVVVAGGRRRQDSVRAGLEAVGTGVDVVAVHDAARPLVDAATVARVVAAAAQSGAALAAARCRDTLKRVDGRGAVVTTADRAQHRLAQTPQAFRTALLREAHARAAAGDAEATDDAALVERLGHAVLCVESPARNLKVTDRGDLRLVEALLAAGAEDDS